MFKKVLFLFSMFVCTAMQAKDYYVKEKGKGDGSNWENALSPLAFAQILPIAESGSIFHIAAGTYYPQEEHTIETYLGDIKSKAFKIGSSVSIIGGYSYDPSMDETPDPDNNITLFSADYEGDDETFYEKSASGLDKLSFNHIDENEDYIFEIGEDNVVLNLYGIQFTGANKIIIFENDRNDTEFFFKKVKAYDNKGAMIADFYTKSVDVDSCAFIRNCVGEEGVIKTEDNNILNFTVKNTYFEGNGTSCLYSKNMSLYNCVFYKNISGAGCVYEIGEGEFSVLNCIFVDNMSVRETAAIFSRASNPFFIKNCTFAGNKTLRDGASGDNLLKASTNLSFIGNLVADGTTFSSAIYTDDFICENNIFTQYPICINKEMPSNETNRLVSLEEMSALIGAKINENNRFTSSLQLSEENKYVELLTDKFSDNSSIRISREATDILYDIKGTKRCEMTCPGACEIDICSEPICVPETTIVEIADTILVGGEIYGQTFAEVGVFDQIYENLISKKGCDSVVSHRVVVKPTSLNYYVKTKRQNKGDGSDWDNAMSGEDFATYLPLAPDGATFYVAEGTYKPVYGVNLNVPSKTSDLCYAINSNVTIRGGYPADAKGKDVPSAPKKYKTIFNGDINGDDEIAETLDVDYLIVSASNRKDNSSHMFFSISQKELHVGFDGILVKSSERAVSIPYPDKYVKISNSEFIYNDYAVHMPSQRENLEVYNSKFLKNFSRVIDMPNAFNLIMDSIRFENNQKCLVYINVTSGENIIVRLNRIYAYANGDNSEIIYSVGHDFSLLNSEFKNNKGNLFLINNTRIDSTVFLNNKCDGTFIYNSKHKMDASEYFSITNSFFKNVESSGFIWSSTDSINITRSEMSGLTNGYIDLRIYKIAVLNECNIHDNNTHFEFIGAKTYLSKNTISNNVADVYASKYELISFSGSTISGAVLTNNTITSNNCPILMCLHGSSTILYNNDIIGNVSSDTSNKYLIHADPGELKLTGNIILGNFPEIIISRWSSYSYKDNILPRIQVAGANSTDEPLDQSLLSDNIFSIFDFSDDIHEELKDIPNRNEEILTYLFEGKYNSKTGLFTPVLKDNGGFTPTVALKSDKLSDGRSIRFPRLENVLTDQRGVERLDSTCMGAYEMNCRPVETELKDTVFVGDSYTFNGKNLDETCQKVGSYHFIETLTSAAGCDSVVKLSLAVRPLKNVSDYYVKTDGKGDGSDWINAMSPKDFAAHLPLVGDGVTFHIANGTYRSTYVDPELGVMYNINSSVRLIGSYPDTVKTVGVPPMPDVFTTTLTANQSGKDYIYIYKNRPGDYSVNGFRDNDSILIRVNGSPTVSLYGITLSGVKSENYGAVTMNDGGTLNLDRCAILKNNASGVVASNVKVNVSATLAYQNVAKDGAVFRLNNSDLNVTQSAFHENISAGENVKAKGAVANLVESRATFVNSTIANNWADMGGAFALSKSEISLANNTFVGNLSINNEGEIGSVLYSDIVSKVTLFGNMIAGNGSSPIYAPTFKSEGYNIFSTDLKSSGAPTDMFMSSKDYPYIIDGDVMPGNADIFIATVGDNGGFTPTVAMIESTFDGGEVISIPLDQRKVKVDQRDMLRKEKSCVGAYEYPTYKNYYVKQSPIGDGTGRDWENAMGDTTFFQYFSAVPAGATFHVAAGIYHPLDDRHNQSKSYSYRRYSSCRPLSVYGGYPPKAELNAVADPSQYVTLLSADFKGDDVFEESTNDYSVMEYFNHKDNSSYLMSIISKVPGVVQLKGVTFSGNYTQFRGVSSALEVSSVSPEISISLKMDSCSFKKTDMGIYSDADTLIARGCCFDSIYYLGMSYYPREAVPCVLEIENSSFTNLNEAFYMYASNGKVLLQNSTFCNAKSLVEINAHSYTKETVDLTLEMYHNTFAFSPKSYVGVRIPNYIHTIAKGNIFNTDFSLLNDPDEKNTIKPVVSDYNLFVDVPDATKKVWTLGENDILVAPSDLKGVLSGTMKDDRFHAASIMKSPENFTKVVALESDVVDHKYIRMPVTEGRVRVDQIATERLDMTCMGAYEMRCDLLDLETVEIDTTKSTNDIVRDDQTKKYDNTCINGDLKVVFYIAGGCGTNLNGYANVVYKYSDSDEQYVSDTIYPQKQANVDIYETTIPYRESSSYIKYRIEVSGMKNGNSKMSSPTSNGFWNVNSCDSMHSIINDPVFALCKEVGNTMSVFVKLGGDTVENGKLTLHYSENVLEESPSEFKNAEFVSPDGENYYAENIELAEETKFFNYYITYGHGDDIRNSLGNGEDDVIRVSVDEIDSICVDPCNNIRLSSHVLVEKDDTLSFDIYRKNTKVELFLCDENGVKLAGKEYYNLPIENKKFNLITELSLRSKDLDLSYVRPYLLALKIDGKVSCMYVYLGRKPRVKPTEK